MRASDCTISVNVFATDPAAAMSDADGAFLITVHSDAGAGRFCLDFEAMDPQGGITDTITVNSIEFQPFRNPADTTQVKITITGP